MTVTWESQLESSASAGCECLIGWLRLVKKVEIRDNRKAPPSTIATTSHRQYYEELLFCGYHEREMILSVGSM